MVRSPSMRLRRLALSGDFADADWTDPANDPPDNARRFEITSSDVVFEIVGLAGTAGGSDLVDVGGLTVDGWVGYEGATYGTPPNTKVSIRRGLSIVEASGSTLIGRIRFVASDAEVGGIGRLHLTLTNVGALAAIEASIVSGARVL